MFKRVGILGHPKRPETGHICQVVAQTLQARGIETWQQAVWDADNVSPRIRDSDMIIAIGGDGAMLRAGRLCGLMNVPVFGINFGHLGFLTEISPDNWESACDALLAEKYWIEKRMMICTQVWRDDQFVQQTDALNEIVIGRGASAKLVLLDTYIDDGWATTYNADGLIVATPTGSTAYALAVGGPILPPELKNILVLPVASHLSLDRALVLSEGATIEVIVREKEANAMLTVDGDSEMHLHQNDVVVVRASEYESSFIRLRERNYFYRSLLDRLEPRIPTHPEPNGHPKRNFARKSES